MYAGGGGVKLPLWVELTATDGAVLRATPTGWEIFERGDWTACPTPDFEGEAPQSIAARLRCGQGSTRTLTLPQVERLRASVPRHTFKLLRKLGTWWPQEAQPLTVRVSGTTHTLEVGPMRSIAPGDVAIYPHLNGTWGESIPFTIVPSSSQRAVRYALAAKYAHSFCATVKYGHSEGYDHIGLGEGSLFGHRARVLVLWRASPSEVWPVHEGDETVSLPVLPGGYATMLADQLWRGLVKKRYDAASVVAQLDAHISALLGGE
jgi:hypothetical protein